MELIMAREDWGSVSCHFRPFQEGRKQRYHMLARKIGLKRQLSRTPASHASKDRRTIDAGDNGPLGGCSVYHANIGSHLEVLPADLSMAIERTWTTLSAP